MRKYPAKIFYCYSHRDEELRDRLEVHLKMLERQNLIKNWHDRKIISGKDWSKEISRKLDDSDIILLLLSPDFLASDYCFEVEMKKAMKLHGNKKVLVVPIILRVCDWKNSPFAKLQGLPLDMTPVLSSYWHNSDEAFHNITEGLKELIQELFDSFPNPDNPLSDSNILVETKVVDVELTINRDYNDFSQSDKKILLESIENFLKLNNSLKIKSIKKGSVILRFELGFENALKLKYAIEDKMFDTFEITSISIKDVINEKEFSEDHFLDLDFKELRNAALVLRALNHKLRQRILPLISKEKSITITELYLKLRLEQTVASQHLAILRRAGIVTTERRGKFIYYSINPEKINSVAKAVKIINGEIDT